MDKHAKALFEIGAIFDYARELYHENISLREQLEDYRKLTGESMNTLTSVIATSERNTLLFGLAMSGKEGQEFARALIKEKPERVTRER